MKDSKKVIVQLWEESEKGQGTRPNGYSLHLTEEDREVFIQKYWNQMPESMPSVFSRPFGKPYKAEVSSERFRKILQSTNSVRCGFERAPEPKKS